MNRLSLALVLALCLNGCAVLRGTEPAPQTAVPQVDVVRENEEVSALLAYYQSLLVLPADEFRREYLSANQAFLRDKTENSRLRLALLLAVPGTAWRDDARLLGLLEGASSRAAPPESPRRQFVALLQKLVSERVREQRRADELQQKLDAVLKIDRSLRSRETKKP